MFFVQFVEKLYNLLNHWTRDVGPWRLLSTNNGAQIMLYVIYSLLFFNFQWGRQFDTIAWSYSTSDNCGGARFQSRRDSKEININSFIGKRKIFVHLYVAW